MNITPSPTVTPSPPVVTHTSTIYDIQDKIDAGNRLMAAQQFARVTQTPLAQVLAEQGLDATGMPLPGGPVGDATYIIETRTMSADTPVYGYSGGAYTPSDVKNYVYSVLKS